MGYYTHFELTTSERQNEILTHLIDEDICELSSMFDYSGETFDSYKWYDHEADMKEISRLFPEVVFTLKGEGEEAGDLWKKHFKNGKMHYCPAVITFEAYDEAKLE